MWNPPVFAMIWRSLDKLGITSSGGAGGQQQQKLRDALPRDRKLRKQLSAIERQLNSERERIVNRYLSDRPLSPSLQCCSKFL